MYNKFSWRKSLKLEKPKLILHIGTEKTGTTTIQSFLRINKDKLADLNFIFPTMLGRPSHQKFTFLGYPDSQNDDISEIAISKSPNKKVAREEIISKIEDLLEKRNSSNDTWIISSEHLSSRLINDKAIKKLKNIIDQYFCSVQIIVYLREPLSAALSSRSTMIRSGSFDVDFNFNNPGGNGYAEERICNHKRILKLWMNSFSKEKIKVRLFDRNRFIKGDLLSDFCSIAGIGDIGSNEFEIPTDENKTLSLKSSIILQEINKCLHEKNFVTQRRDLDLIIQNIDFKDHRKICPPIGTQEKWDLWFKNNHEFVRNEFFPEISGRLWTGNIIERNDPLEDLISEEEKILCDVISKIWKAKIKRIVQLEKFNQKLVAK